MEETLIGQIEPVVFAPTINGAPIVGATMVFSVVRLSDGFALDFTGPQPWSFVASPATPTHALTETAPGLYSYLGLTLGPASISNLASVDTIVFTPSETNPTARTFAARSVNVGRSLAASIAQTISGLVSLDISSLTNAKTLGGAITRLRKWLTWTSATPNVKQIVGQNIVVRDDDGTTPLDTAPLHDISNGPIAPGVGEPAKIG